MTAIVQYCADSFAYLRGLGAGEVDVILTDPPYSEHVHKNLCSGSLVGTKAVPKYELPFAPLKDYAWLEDAVRVAKRWAISFCDVEAFGLIKGVLPEEYIRGGVWYKSNCLAARTELYARTASGDGPMRIEHLVRLPPEAVQLWDGDKWTQVKAWLASSTTESARVQLRSGERISCTWEHVWPTERGNVSTRDLAPGDVIRTTRLPSPPKAPSLIDSEDVGWLIGTYLGDGSRSGDTIQISSNVNESDRFARLERIAAAFDAPCSTHKTSANGATCNIFSTTLLAIIDRHIGGRDAHTKYLLPPVWRKSDVFVLGLLRGYLDADGSWRKDANIWQFNTCQNRHLVRSLRTACARMGWDMRVTPCKVHGFGKDFSAFRWMIREGVSHHANAKNAGEVLGVDKGWAVNFWDVTVTDAPNLFALSSGVLTHNSMGQLTADRPATAYEGIAILHGTKAAGHPKKRWNGRGSYGIWRCNGTRGKKGRHPNEKPLDLCLKLVALFSERGETVFDPFCGSGAIGEACLILGRNYIGLDNDPAWVEKADVRMALVHRRMADEEALMLCSMKGADYIEIFQEAT